MVNLALQAMGRAKGPERVTRARSSFHASAPSGFGPTIEPAKPSYLKCLPNEVIRRILYYLDRPDLYNAAATGMDFFSNSDSLAFIADVPKFPIIRRCDPRPQDRIREQRLDNESSQRHRILSALADLSKAADLKSFTLLQRTKVPIETALSICGRQRLKAAIFRDYSRLQTLQVLYELCSTAPKLEHLHVGFLLPVQVLHLIGERCKRLRSLATPLQGSIKLTPFHSLRSLTVLDVDLKSAALGGSNGLVILFLGQLDSLAVQVKGYLEPERWTRHPTQISLDGFPMLQHVSIFSDGPFSPHAIFHGSAITVHTVVIDGPFEFHYATQLRAFFRKFRHMKSLSVRNLRFWYSPVPQQAETLPRLESLEIVELDPRYFIFPDLKLTQFRMSRAAGMDHLGSVTDLLASSLQQQKLQTLSLCLLGRLPLDSTFINLIACTNVTLKNLQFTGKKLVTYEDRWRLLRNRLIPSLETAHVQGGWLSTSIHSEASCRFPQAGEDLFHRHGRTRILKSRKEITTEYFNGRFIEKADPSGHFAFAWGAKSPVLIVGEEENHVRSTILNAMPLISQSEIEL